jgi:two-component system response regulator HydG
MSKILIFSQDKNLQKNLSSLLKKNSYEVSVFSDSEEAIDHIREEDCDLIFIDFLSKNAISHELVTSIHCFHDLLPIIVITDNKNISAANEAIKNGATTYVTKPLSPEALLLTLKIALSQADTMIENLLYKCNFYKTHDCNFLLSSSDFMMKIYSQVEKISRTDLAVMLRGEAGSGKKTIARRIHNKSQRNSYSFYELDCASIPAEMQDSELFGYARNITSKETQNIAGVFEQSIGGTVFLDNVDALSINTQVKLLYLLKNKKIQLIGSSKMVNINIRLIVSSSCNLQEKAANDEFCKEFYHKLSTASITLPPLRERRKEIPEIVEYFLVYFANMNSRQVEISSQALAILCEYNWPGNIEQLKKLIMCLVSESETGEISSEELPPELLKHTDSKLEWGEVANDKLDNILPLKKYLQSQEKSYMLKFLEHSGGDKKLAAKKLGISLASFYRKLQEAML